MSAEPMIFAVVDPHAALYRYLTVVHGRGYRAVVLTANADDCYHHESLYHAEVGQPDVTEIDELVECDVSSADAITAALEPYRERLAGLVAGNETSVAAVVETRARLGIPGARPEDGRCQQIKSAMKRRFAERGVPTAPFVVATSLDEAERAWTEFGGDCMIKMVDFVSSANVFRVRSREELRFAWESIIYNRLALQTSFTLASEVIVEEFVGGRELSAEGYVDDDGVTILNHCEKVTSESFVVIGHYVPAQLSEAERVAVDDAATRCVRALGLRNSVFHVEVHVRDGEAFVIECAGRPPGQHISGMIHEAYGFDLLDINVDLVTGKPVAVTARPPGRYFAVLVFYAERAGVFAGVDGLHELLAKGMGRRHHLALRPGDLVEPLANFRHRYGFVILEGDTAGEVREQAAWVRANVKLRVVDEPADLVTP